MSTSTSATPPRVLELQGLHRNPGQVQPPAELYLDTCFLLDIYIPNNALRAAGVRGLSSHRRHYDCLALVRDTINAGGFVYASEYALAEAFRKLAVSFADVLAFPPLGQKKWWKPGTKLRPGQHPIPPEPNNNFDGWYKNKKRTGAQGFMAPVVPIFEDVLNFLEWEQILVLGMDSVDQPRFERVVELVRLFDLQPPDGYHVSIAESFPPCTAFATTDQDFQSMPGIQVYRWS